MDLMQLMRGRARRAWRVLLADPTRPHARPPPDASPVAPPVRVGWVPLSKTPLRRKRSTDAGPWSSDPPDRWKR